MHKRCPNPVITLPALYFLEVLLHYPAFHWVSSRILVSHSYLNKIKAILKKNQNQISSTVNQQIIKWNCHLHWTPPLWAPSGNHLHDRKVYPFLNSQCKYYVSFHCGHYSISLRELSDIICSAILWELPSCDIMWLVVDVLKFSMHYQYLLCSVCDYTLSNTKN